jgi:sterol desaturase/sphingolipid hydroxylase (fatty acid hydroxylase superfamily)
MHTLEKLLAIDLNYIIVALIFLFYTLESFLSTQFAYEKRGGHLLQNILFQVSIYLGNLLWAFVMVYAIEWLNRHEIGLLYLFDVPLWLKLVLGVFMFDFGSYWFHRMAHRVPFLWRFHRVHHSDTHMDASTSLRSHPVEIVVYFGIAGILTAALFGLDLMSFGFYLLVLTPFLFLEHSNLKFPTWLDKTFGLFFTTPNIHKVHHEQDQYYTDSNYSDIFIIWDRIFGTYKYKAPSDIRFGLKEFDDDQKQTFWYLLRSPFMNIRRVGSGRAEGL